MAWTASKIFSVFVQDAFNRTSAYDLNADTFKAALYDNDVTPDQTVSSANSAYNAGQWTASGNEVSDGAEWAAGGVALASVTSAFSSNIYTFDAADTASGTSATLANVFGCLVYDDTTSDLGVCFNYFGGTNSVTDGTFTIQWHANGIFRITL